MNPEEALQSRDEMVAILNRAAQGDLRLVGNDQSMGNESAQWMANSLTSAGVFIWKTPLWVASQKGNEVFTTTEFHIPRTTSINQLWLFEDPGVLSFFSSADEPEWKPFGFFVHLNPAGAFQAEILSSIEEHELRFRFSTAPFQKANEPCRADYARILSASLFLDMEFVGRERQTLPRHVRRAAELKRRLSLPEINIVQLRRTAKDEARAKGEADSKEWSCSWLVSGHWRRQWYPSTAEWKPRFIAPHIKGDLDKPLRTPKGSIYVVNR